VTDRHHWHRVKQLFQALLEHDSSGREAFLREACGSDASLQAEVKSLFSAHLEASSFGRLPIFAHLSESAAGELRRVLDNGTTVLQSGDRLGAYEITEFLGAGAMGEVYRARDTNLRRDVAVKVLPQAFSSDSERLAQLEQEARVLASVNHPNIATIHALEEAAGARALILELVEGPTLAARLRAGPLPPVDALTIARQIAEGLDAAHDKGIVHRDLKPANIKIANDGTVKLLDFGLAKMTAAPGSPLAAMCKAGDAVIAGTPSYMSPEQARGQPVDKRTDIWALGCVLYEMLAGRGAFAGTTIADVLNATTQGEPDWRSLPESTPTAIRTLLKRCLTKDPKRRLRDAGDAALEIEASMAGDVPPSILDVERRDEIRFATARESRARSTSMVAAAFLSGVLIASSVVIWYSEPAATIKAAFTIHPPAGAVFAAASTAVPSPDGRRLAFVASRPGEARRIWLRPVDSLAAEALPGTDGAVNPFWSPDGRSIAFFARGKLNRLDLGGGPPHVIAETPTLEPGGGAWGTAGIILFTSVGPLYQVPASGGTPRIATKVDPSRLEYGHNKPYFLPDGRHFLFFARTGSDESRGVYLSELDSNEATQILAVGSKAEYAQGYLLYVRGTTLMARSFDGRRFQLYGDEAPIATNVPAEANTGRALFSVSRAGVLTYQSVARLEANDLVWVNRSGKRLGVLGPQAGYLQPFLSPDDKRVGVEIADSITGKHAIWVLDTSTGLRTRFKLADDGSHYPTWSPDGSRILFFSDRDGRGDLYQKIASGAGPEELVLKSERTKNPIDWSRDGRFVIYSTNMPGGQRDLWALPLGTREPFPYLNTDFDEAQGRFSPDGKWIAYASNESGRMEVYVRPFPASGARRQVSTDGGAYPVWRRDQKELFYVAPDGHLMAAAVGQGSTIETERPVELFQMPDQVLARGNFAIATDGQRFLIVEPADDSRSSPINVILDWKSALPK
jgi:serine/threonine protein kinase/Tol biopolymer transport system component